VDFDPSPSASKKFNSPPHSFGESLVTSNQKSKRTRKRKSKKNKSPTSASHVGDLSSSLASHARESGQHLLVMLEAQAQSLQVILAISHEPL
jgi:hypothetical protein